MHLLTTNVIQTLKSKSVIVRIIVRKSKELLVDKELIFSHAFASSSKKPTAKNG